MVQPHDGGMGPVEGTAPAPFAHLGPLSSPPALACDQPAKMATGTSRSPCKLAGGCCPLLPAALSPPSAFKKTTVSLGLARNIPVRKRKPSQGLGYVFFGWSTLEKLHPRTYVNYTNTRLRLLHQHMPCPGPAHTAPGISNCGPQTETG